MIAFLAEKLRALNPLLLDHPPSQEGNDFDKCYVTINCGDLPHGMRPNVASWYLTPQQHVKDAIVVTVVSGSLLWWLQYRRKITITNGKTSTNTCMCHPVWVKPVSVACWLLIMVYKLKGSYLSKMYYMIMPCNMLWTLVVLLTCGPPSLQPAALQLLCTYIGSAAVALALPDTKDCVLFGEAFFFFLNHTILLIIPFAYIWIDSLSMRVDTSAHIHWWASACCWFGLFYFTIGMIGSVMSGLNLNYMMNPPPNQDVVVGIYYRYMSTALCAIQFALARFFLWSVEVVALDPLKRLIGKSSDTNRSKLD